MSKVEFKYKHNTINILCYQNEIMESICKKFADKIHTDIKNLIFLYGGIIVDLKLKFSQVINKMDSEQKIMTILVNEIDSENTNSNTGIIKSMYPICPKCSEIAILEIESFKANIIGCKNRHVTKDIILNEYENTQKIDLSKIKCNICKISQKDTYENNMFICNKCKIYLCPLHKQSHDEDHIVINEKDKNYNCEYHNEIYISYCQTCNINICLKCEKAHSKHNITSFGSILPEKEELLNKLGLYRNIITIFNKNINEMINKLIDVRDNIDTLYKIYYDMISHYQDKHRNYQVFIS